jgi:tetratricopeptide (TPR) repeat protein
MSAIKNQAIIYFNDGSKLYKIKLFEEALLQYEKAIANDPTLHDAHFCVAKTQLRLKDFENGIAHFNKYIHLIPIEKQDAYIIALSNILLEENRPIEALNLMDSLDMPITEEETFIYAPFLIANNKANEAIHKILNLKDKNKISAGYKKLIENEKLSGKSRNALKSANIIPYFFNSIKTLQLLKSSGILHKEFAPTVQELSSQLEKIKSNESSNYTLELQSVDEIIAKTQSIIASHTETVLKSNNFLLAKKQIDILEQTKYNTDITSVLRQRFRKQEKIKNQKTTKKIIIIGISLLIICTASYFGYKAYEKSEARTNALRSNSVSSYTRYLNKYGDDSEINKLRENKLYRTAIENNDAKDFTSLISFYPNSEYLKLISINVLGNKSHNISSYGLGNRSQKTRMLGGKKNQFKVPIGAKVGYVINSVGMIPIERVFTVSEDLQIKESLSPSKELLFDEQFNSNRNGWKTFSSSKVVYGRTKYKTPH